MDAEGVSNKIAIADYMNESDGYWPSVCHSELTVSSSGEYSFRAHPDDAAAFCLSANEHQYNTTAYAGSLILEDNGDWLNGYFECHGAAVELVEGETYYFPLWFIA